MRCSESLFELFPNFTFTIRSTHSEKKSLIETGIAVIDDVLGGIMKTDLTVIASSTGLGKTQLALNIAINIAMSGLNCVMYSFESYKEEIQERYIYSLLLKELNRIGSDYVEFRKWVTGHASKEIYELESQITRKLDSRLDNLKVKYRDEHNYTSGYFKHEIISLCREEKIDIIIIDHLHYFDMPENKSENVALRDLIQTLRDIGLQLHKPIILFAHLRKKDKSDKTLIPDETEIHGSSEIPKNATNVITMNHACIKAKENYIIPTFFRFPKLRFDEGGKKRYLYCAQFDLRNLQYDKVYKLLKPKNYWNDFDIVGETELPRWAVNAKKVSEFELNMGEQ